MYVSAAQLPERLGVAVLGVEIAVAAAIFDDAMAIGDRDIIANRISCREADLDHYAYCANLMRDENAKQMDTADQLERVLELLSKPLAEDASPMMTSYKNSQRRGVIENVERWLKWLAAGSVSAGEVTTMLDTYRKRTEALRKLAEFHSNVTSLDTPQESK